MYHYELHQEMRAELLRRAERRRLVAEARRASRDAERERRSGPSSSGPDADNFSIAA